jgi:predicted RNA-binding Zn ribbon-like protein
MKTQPMTAPLEVPSRAASLALVGGALCLDFANTSSGRGTLYRLEHLRDWQHLLAWSAHAGVVDRRRCRTIAAASRDIPPPESSLARALRLREAIHAIFHATAAGGAVPRDSIAILNEVLSEAMSRARLRCLGDRYAWTWASKPMSPAQLLWPIARSAAELLIGRELARVKICPGSGCGWLFVDRTRNSSRRWCEMEVCGSRAKMRRYRQRRRQPSPDPLG